MTTTQIHVIANQKGGVGKTTLAMQLGAVTYDALVQPDPIMRAAAEAVGDPTSPVLVASTDPQASALWWYKRGERTGGLPFDVIQLSDPRELRLLRESGRAHIFVDTPGNLHTADILRATLDQADDVLVPLLTESLSYDPTARTIEQIILPCGVPYRVVVNNWDPRDGVADRDQTISYARKRGWPLCNTVVRHYKLHTRASAEGTVVTRYAANRTSLQAAQDFYKLALELGYGGQQFLAGRPAAGTALPELEA